MTKPTTIEDVREAILSVPEEHYFEPEELQDMYRIVWGERPDADEDPTLIYSLICSKVL